MPTEKVLGLLDKIKDSLSKFEEEITVDEDRLVSKSTKDIIPDEKDNKEEPVQGGGDFADVPYPPDKPYITHKGVGEQDREEDFDVINTNPSDKVKHPVPLDEQDEEEETEEETVPDEELRAGEEPPVTPPAAPTEPPEDLAGTMEDPTMAGMDTGMGMGYGYGKEPPKTAPEIGKLYEMKKIYSRLLAIESFLSTVSDPFLLKMRLYIGKAIDLFDTVISNFQSFKDRLGDIIVVFYRFLEDVYSSLEDYYKDKKEE